MTDEEKRIPTEHKTGRIPRMDVASVKFEAPQPLSLPEFPDGDPMSITGFIKKMPVEGIDKAKHADDDAVRTQGGEGVQPKKQ